MDNPARDRSACVEVFAYTDGTVMRLSVGTSVAGRDRVNRSGLKFLEHNATRCFAAEYQIKQWRLKLKSNVQSKSIKIILQTMLRIIKLQNKQKTNSLV